MPHNQFPGDQQIAGGAISKRTIPDTSITIRQIETGWKEQVKTLCLKVGIESCSKNPYFRVTVAFVVV